MTDFNAHKNINSISDLYREYEQPIFRYLYRLTNSSQIAEDLTQETFYQAIISIHRFKGDSKVSTWLFKIARHLYLNDRRSQIKQQKIEYEIRDTFRMENAEDHTSPEKALEKKVMKAGILKILQNLPEHYRSIILLKEVEGLSHEEISKIMGKTIPTTKVTLFRAKQKFQEEYLKIGVREE